MREVEVSRFVPATVAELDRHLSPAAVVEAEGTFTVDAVTETDDGWTVAATAGGMTAEFAFEPREDGYHYSQVGDRGPFEAMETTLSLARENEGTIVTARSVVSLGLPLGVVTDRVAAWKRRGELDRALEAFADAVG